MSRLLPGHLLQKHWRTSSSRVTFSTHLIFNTPRSFSWQTIASHVNPIQHQGPGSHPGPVVGTNGGGRPSTPRLYSAQRCRKGQTGRHCSSCIRGGECFCCAIDYLRFNLVSRRRDSPRLQKEQEYTTCAHPLYQRPTWRGYAQRLHQGPTCGRRSNPRVEGRHCSP